MSGVMGTSSTFSVLSSISLLKTLLLTVKSKYTSVKSALHCLLSEVCLAPAYSAVPYSFLFISKELSLSNAVSLGSCCIVCFYFSPFFKLCSLFLESNIAFKTV